MKKTKSAASIRDCQPHSANPRWLAEGNRGALKASLERLGDISTLTYDRNSGQMICGHQRRDVILEHFNPGEIEWGEYYQTPRGEERHGSFALPDGSRFVVREVAWTPAMVREAMVIANSPELMGVYTAGLEELLAEIKAETSTEDFETLRLDILVDSLGSDFDELDDGPGTKDEQTPYKTEATIGEFRFKIEREPYLAWLEELRQTAGFEKAKIIEEIKRRLRLT